MTSSFVLAVFERSSNWNPTIGLIMLISVILATLIGRATIQRPNVGPKFPVLSDLTGLSLPALLATFSFGHLLGTGVILGLTDIGVLG